MKENLTIGRRLKDLCPPGLQTELQVFGFLRENLTNLEPRNAQRNLENLRKDWPSEEGIPFDVPKVLTPEFEGALRSGELGDRLRTAYLAGIIQAGQSITDDEKKFVKKHCPEVDLGTFTWGLKY